jgi:hypothetical protein
MSNERKYKLRSRLSDLYKKLSETEDSDKKKKIDYDIRILKLRLDIERFKELKKSN